MSSQRRPERMKSSATDCEDGEEDGPVYQFRRIGSGATCKGVKDDFKVVTSTTKIGRQLDEVDFYLNSTVNKRLISRQHAQLERIHDGKQWRFILIDTSLNGTYVNDVKVSGQTELKVGDTVTFGHTNGINVRDGMVAWQPNSEFRFVFECVYSQSRGYAKKAASQNSSVSSSEQASVFQQQSEHAALVKSENASAHVKQENLLNSQQPALPVRHSAMDSIKQAFSEAAVDGVAALAPTGATTLEDLAKGNVPSSAATTAHWLSEKYNQKPLNSQAAKEHHSSTRASTAAQQNSSLTELPLSSPSQKSPSRIHHSSRTPVRNSSSRAAASDVYDFVETDEQKRELKVKKSPMASTMAASAANPVFNTFHLQQQLAMQNQQQQHQHLNVPHSQGAISDPNYAGSQTHAQMSLGSQQNQLPTYVSKPVPPMTNAAAVQQSQDIKATGIPSSHNVNQNALAAKYSEQLQSNLMSSHKTQSLINPQIPSIGPNQATVAPVQSSLEQPNVKGGIIPHLPQQIHSSKQLTSFHPSSQIIPNTPNISTVSSGAAEPVYIQKPMPSSLNQFNHNFNSPSNQQLPPPNSHVTHASKTPIASVVPQQQVAQQPTTKQATPSGSSSVLPNTVKVEPFSKAEQDKRLNKPTQKVSPVSVDKSRARKDKDREMLSSWINTSTANTGPGRKTLTSLNSDLGYLSRLNVDDAIQSSEDPSPTGQKAFSPVKIKPEKKSEHVHKAESPYNSSTNKTENTMEEIRALFSSVKRPSAAVSKDMSNQAMANREPIKIERKDKASKQQHIPTSVKQQPQSDNSDEDGDNTDDDDDEEEDSSSSEGEDSDENGSSSSSDEHTEQASAHHSPSSASAKKQAANSTPASSNVLGRNKVTSSQKKPKHVLNPPPPQVSKSQHQSQSRNSNSQKVSPSVSLKAQQSSKVVKKKVKATSGKKAKSAAGKVNLATSKKPSTHNSKNAKQNIKEDISSRKRKQSSSTSSSSGSDNDQSDSDEESAEEPEVHDQRKRSALASSNSSGGPSKKKGASENSSSRSRSKKKTPHVSFKERNRAAAIAASAAVQSSGGANSKKNNSNSSKKGPKSSAEKSASGGGGPGSKSGKKVMYYQEEMCDSPDCLKPSGSTIDWVQCDDCDLWFHTVCVGCNLEVVQKVNASFHCGCV